MIPVEMEICLLQNREQELEKISVILHSYRVHLPLKWKGLDYRNRIVTKVLAWHTADNASVPGTTLKHLSTVPEIGPEHLLWCS